MRVFRLARALAREALKGLRRSPRWRATRRAHLEAHPTCAACGGARFAQVHHVEPVHLFPDLELDPSNLMTLCAGKWECHLEIGHGGNYSAWNPRARTDAAAFKRNEHPMTRRAIVAMAKATRRDDASV